MRGREHLTKPEQYGLVYKKGASWVDKPVVMRALPNGLGFSRYGLSVSHKVGGAVVRNRVKRLFREILRAAPLQAGWDIVLIARQPAAVASYNELKSSVTRLLERASILDKKVPEDPGLKEISGT